MKIERVAVVFAHPDDAEHACAGTIAAWIRSNKARVLYVSVTSGEQTSRGPTGWSTQEIAQAREESLLQAAAIIGIDDTVFMHHADGKVCDRTVTPDLKAVLVRFRPRIVMTHDPDRVSGHPDHIAVGRAAMEAARTGGVEQVWLFRPEQPTTIIDISQTMAVKIRALAAHTLTIRPRFARNLIAANRAVGQPMGYRYGEDFHVVTM